MFEVKPLVAVDVDSSCGIDQVGRPLAGHSLVPDLVQVEVSKRGATGGCSGVWGAGNQQLPYGSPFGFVDEEWT